MRPPSRIRRRGRVALRRGTDWRRQRSEPAAAALTSHRRGLRVKARSAPAQRKGGRKTDEEGSKKDDGEWANSSARARPAPL
jgi:hypothetical protein